MSKTKKNITIPQTPAQDTRPVEASNESKSPTKPTKVPRVKRTAKELPKQEPAAQATVLVPSASPEVDETPRPDGGEDVVPVDSDVANLSEGEKLCDLFLNTGVLDSKFSLSGSGLINGQKGKIGVRRIPNQSGGPARYELWFSPNKRG